MNTSILLLSIISSLMFGAIAQNIGLTSFGNGGVYSQVLPDPSLSSFASSLYNALMTRNIFSRIFDVSFSPASISSEFYGETLSFEQKMGVTDVGSFPQLVSDTSAIFAKGITPVQYFKAVANSIDSLLRKTGFLTLYNQEQLIQSYASFLQAALLSTGLLGPEAGLKALSLGTANFLNSLGHFTQDQITSLISMYVNEMNRI